MSKLTKVDDVILETTMITQIEMNQMECRLKEKKTNHILHLLMSVITGGFWISMWIMVACANCSGRNDIRRTAGLKEEPNYGATILVTLFGCVAVAMLASG